MPRADFISERGDVRFVDYDKVSILNLFSKITYSIILNIWEGNFDYISTFSTFRQSVNSHCI